MLWLGRDSKNLRGTRTMTYTYAYGTRTTAYTNAYDTRTTNPRSANIEKNEPTRQPLSQLACRHVLLISVKQQGR